MALRQGGLGREGPGFVCGVVLHRRGLVGAFIRGDVLAQSIGASRHSAFPSNEGPRMNGHWYGLYSGSNTGQIVIEIDDRGEYFDGSAYVYSPSGPGLFAYIKTIDKSDRATLKSPLAPFYPRSRYFTDWKRVVNQFPNNTIIPNEAEVDFECDGQCLIVR